MTDGVIIRGGTIVSDGRRFRGDVVVGDGKVLSVSTGGEHGGVKKSIDASGCFVMPGGIDGHTHFDNPALDFTTATIDTFATGSAAAAAGGTTTFIDFAKRVPGQDLLQSFRERLDIASEQAIIDFGFHPVVPPEALADGTLGQLEQLTVEYGATSWKVFLAYPGMRLSDETVMAAFEGAKKLGVLPVVHAESGSIVEHATDKLVADGNTGEANHLLAHPHLAEAEGAWRAACFAKVVNLPILFLHVSSRWVLDVIAYHRAAGGVIFGETCPHYLLLASEDYNVSDELALRYICSPPIRERANAQYLWDALASDVLSLVSTDHAPFALTEAASTGPQKRAAPGYFPGCPNGVPGVEERLALLYHYGVNAGVLTLERFVDVVSTTPARLFGLYPRKGTISVGSDADITVWDPSAEHVLRASTQHSTVDYSLYEGWVLRGRPRTVLSRGEVVWDGDQIVGEEGRGRYQRRSVVAAPQTKVGVGL